MVQINWTRQAVENLRNIYEFISADSVYYAKRQISKIKIRTRSLKDFPRIGRIVPEFNDRDIRELIEGRYRIVYKIIDQSTIDILTIHHSSKDQLDIDVIHD